MAWTLPAILRNAAAFLQKAVGPPLAPPVPAYGTGSGWYPFVREMFGGAWQRNVTGDLTDVVGHSTLWACVTLIASDISKGEFRLVKTVGEGLTAPTTSPAFSPVLAKPNHYQNRIVFYTCWLLSKLLRGNTYVLKARDARNVVTALYVLDPARVTVLVSPAGEVFYQLAQDNLADLPASITVPAEEIIHDIMVPLYHPLVGVSPLYACGGPTLQGLKIQQQSSKLFASGSQLSGVLTAPGTIPPDTAERVRVWWENNYAGERNIGKVAVLGDGLKFEPMTMTAVDAQLIDQLKWSDEKICSVYHVPPYMVGVGQLPTYTNGELGNQQYYSQCLQALIEAIELCLEEGLGTTTTDYAIEYDLDALLRMDSATKMKTATDGVKGGIYTPNDARAIFNKQPLKGGDTVYLQQQDYSIAALAERDKNGPPASALTTPAPAPAALPAASAPRPPAAPPKALDAADLALLIEARLLQRITSPAPPAEGRPA